MKIRARISQLMLVAFSREGEPREPEFRLPKLERRQEAVEYTLIDEFISGIASAPCTILAIQHSRSRFTSPVLSFFHRSSTFLAPSRPVRGA